MERHRSAEWRIRPFRAGDDEQVVAAWNRTLVRDPISAALFQRQTLLDPNFQAAGCLLAEAAGEPVGFALALASRTTGLFAGASGSGRLVGLGVVPEARRRGIGTALLEAAVAFLREHSCQRVSVAAHEYYVAGVDKDAYGEGIGFLAGRGFREAAAAVAMGRELYDLVWPAEVRGREAQLRREGIEVRYFQPPDTYALVEYFRAEFPTWVEFFVKKVDARHDPDEMVIATDGGRIIGYCQHLDGDHVGPFGVAAGYRNRGIGTLMLYRLLDRMRAKGYRFAWFGETGRAQRYYERAGFHVTRRYSVLVRDLRPDLEPAHAPTHAPLPKPDPPAASA